MARATSKPQMKAGFIGIGAQKCATSWLHDILAGHNEVATSDPKELNYFNANYERGDHWYEQHFDVVATSKIAGEFSPNYFMSGDAVERAYRYNPDMRLLVLLRDPVDRMFSNHLHEIRKKHIPEDLSFADAMERNPAYSMQSHYKLCISRWLDVFPREQLLVLFAEDISTQPKTAFEKLALHLGISSDVDDQALGKRSHESVSVKSEALRDTLRFGGNLARKAGVGSAVETLKSAPGISSLLNANKKDLRTLVPSMPAETRKRLEELFQPDMEFVADLTNRPDLPWRSWTSVNQQIPAATNHGEPVL